MNNLNVPDFTVEEAIDKVNEVIAQIYTLLQKLEEQDHIPTEEDVQTFDQLHQKKQDVINETAYYDMDEQFIPYIDTLNEGFSELEGLINGVPHIAVMNDPVAQVQANIPVNAANDPPLPMNEDPAFPANGGRRKINKTKKSKKTNKTKKSKKSKGTKGSKDTKKSKGTKKSKKTKGRKH